MRRTADAGFCVTPARMRPHSNFGRPLVHRALSEFFTAPVFAQRLRSLQSAPRSLCMNASGGHGTGNDGSSLGRLRAMQRDIVRRRREKAGTGQSNAVTAAEGAVSKPVQSRGNLDSVPPPVRTQPFVEIPGTRGDSTFPRKAFPKVPEVAQSSRPEMDPPSIEPADVQRYAKSKPFVHTRTRQDMAPSRNTPSKPPNGLEPLSPHQRIVAEEAVSLSNSAPSLSSKQISNVAPSEDAVNFPRNVESMSPPPHGVARVASPPYEAQNISLRTAESSPIPLTEDSSTHRQDRGLSSFRSTSDSSVSGHWLERVDGRLPLAATVTTREVDVAPSDVRVWIPTFDEAMGLRGLETLRRESGNLPRLSAAMAQQAAKATAKSLGETKVVSQDSMARNAPRSHILESLNKPQRLAVVAEPGKPCLVLAGPGSGKTRVLSYRAAYLVQELGVSPHQVIAVTFTNKAAGEMKERIDKLLGLGSNASGDMVVGTFHSICARLLRMHGLGINIAQNFDIADQSDARSLLSGILKERLGDECDADVVSQYSRKISMIKNERGDELQGSAAAENSYKRVVEVMKLYNDKMRSMNKLDFDDLLVETRRLLDECVDVRRLLQTRFHHVLVDEWQDTNTVQYEIVSILAASHRNLFVVGDGDQSIYKFRGADSRNMDRFAKDFEDAETVALVENYRSTQCIVQAAQAVIQRNKKRPDKKMITSNSFGDAVDVVMCEDPRDEVKTVMNSLKNKMRASPGGGYSDSAILYRTNAQSRLFEEACVKDSIPYRLIGGLRFYERAEIKDLLAYLRLLRNPLDDTSLKRAINTPPRGLGQKTVEALEDFAVDQGMSMMSALDYLFGDEARDEDGYGLMKGASKKRLAEFYSIVGALRESLITEDDYTVAKTLTYLIERVKFKEYSAKIGGAAAGGEKAEERWRNVTELLSAASRYPALDTFMENVALVSDVKEVDDGSGNVVRPQAISLMTLHGGKGLEFDNVFLAGMEEGLVPLIFRDENNKEDALEEERRLAYVGMTRARTFLHLSWRRRKLKMHAGKTPFYGDCKRSRFLDDLPAHLIKEQTTAAAKSNLWRNDTSDAKASGRKSSGTTVFKSAKDKSKLISYSSSGTASKLAAPYQQRANDTPLKVGDSVRESSGLRGVIVSADENSATVSVVFANGEQRSMPKSACTRLYAV